MAMLVDRRTPDDGYVQYGVKWVERQRHVLLVVMSGATASWALRVEITSMLGESAGFAIVMADLGKYDPIDEDGGQCLIGVSPGRKKSRFKNKH
ncbi:uncharacterized protein PHALS_11262 [Plasmopara halstedii]|uniref:Uncharacterized protein n=1 Tax=Plasmopara halstedii TaxID=4781 RepID=A0A0P1AJN4_PLAHL|nr:uncharacterized protein PHALS_11262 [Plasmopara halstedii]CEG41095.1 hypothetical protein PHALS_11262 [Plasmopara halstedii]|eukprot:XP_024577464.1 hypothetical protein PHALS_11262 [Plasmopara halstedii]